MTTLVALIGVLVLSNLIFIAAAFTHMKLLKECRSRLKLSMQEYTELQQKFQKNPSYECQQLLANLLSGHALFHIETIDPENVFLRRR